jgi:hypothetical protein
VCFVHDQIENEMADDSNFLYIDNLLDKENNFKKLAQ